MTQSKGSDASAWYSKANAFFDSGKSKEAIESYDKAIKIDSKYVEAWSNRGSALFKLGKYKEAIESYDKAIKIDSKYVGAWRFKGNALLNLCKYKEAITSYEEAIKIEPDNADVWNAKGVAFYYLPVNKKDAFGIFDKVTQIDPSYTLAWENKVTLHVRDGNMDEAIKCVDESLKSTAEPFKMYDIKGYIYYLRGEFDNALKNFEMALKNKPDYLDTVLNKCDVYEAKGDYDLLSESYKEAEKIANNILRRTKSEEEDHISALVQKGDLFIRLGRYNEAIEECYQKVISDVIGEPGYVHDALIGKSRALCNLGKYQEAIDESLKALKKVPTSASAAVIRGLCLDILGKYKDAIECYEEALKTDTANIDLLVSKGLSLVNRGEYKKAIEECFDKALKINPNHLKTLTNKGKALSNIGEYKKAIEECFDKALKINPVYGDALINRGEALYNQKLRKDADESFRRAKDCYDRDLNINPKSIEALTNKGVALYRLEEYKKAIGCYEDALDVNRYFVKAWFNKGLALYSLKKYHNAKHCFVQCLVTTPNYTQALIGKGWVYNDLKEYEKAIESYDEALRTALDSEKSLVSFSKGESKYGLGRYASALEDFKNIANDKYNGQKQVNMGLCYYQLGFYEDAEKKYLEAINFSSELAFAYYNLAVLYNSENKRDKAKKMLKSCLNIDRNYTQAREAIKQFEYSEQSDWYNWWFRGSGLKKLFGIGVIAFILSLIVVTVYITLGSEHVMIPLIGNVTMSNEPTTITGNVAAMTALIAILVGMLLLPSLKTIKVAGVEMASEFPVDKNVELEPAIANFGNQIRSFTNFCAYTLTNGLTFIRLMDGS